MATDPLSSIQSIKRHVSQTVDNKKEPTTNFQDHMQRNPADSQNISSNQTQQSPALPSSHISNGQVSMQEVIHQVHAASGALEELKGTLNHRGNRIKTSENKLIKKKVELAHQKIRETMNQLGLTHQGAIIHQGIPNGRGGPAARFLDFLNDGQRNLANIKRSLNSMEPGQSLRPADLLRIQIKMSQAQQAMEYSSLLLSKAVDGIKQLMNIQI
ncbi:MAG: hypothetical protein VXZ72_01625 [Chlamydiota bacterium]|nr:hypothetical protein [Chlamydiota bacterium]